MKKRITILAFYDSHGKVDRYLKYFMENIRSVSEYIVVVCNGLIDGEGRAYFEENADFFYCRENKGIDIEADKDAIHTIGWEKIYEYDELILTNVTLFGPFYPLSEMFDEMDSRNVDYWGITKVFEDRSRTTLWGKDVLPDGYIPDYTLSNFRVIGSALLHSFEFRCFWDKLPPIKDYAEAGLYGEIYFNKVFRDAGFTFDTYMTDAARGSCESPNVNEMLRLVIEERNPFIRKRAFTDPYDQMLKFGFGEEPCRLIEYIDRETDYDVSMIYENLIRITDPDLLFARLQQNHIIPENSRLSSSLTERRTAAVIYLYAPAAAEELAGYIDSFGGKTDIYIAAGSTEVTEALEASGISCKEVRCCDEPWGELSALLITFGDMVLGGGYDYICFAHDMKRIEGLRKCGDSRQQRDWTAMFGSADVVENIISTFENNPYLGLICPPPAYHGDEFLKAEDIRSKHNKEISNAAQLLGIDGSVRGTSYASESVFWFRPAALKTLFEREWTAEELTEDFLTYVQLLMPYVLKQNGFLFGCALTDVQAKSELTNEGFMLDSLKKYINMGAQDETSFSAANKALYSRMRTAKPQNKPAAAEKPVTVQQKARLYPDYGEGYGYRWSEDGGIVGASGKYSCDFTLEKKAHRLRFDPTDGTACLVRNACAVSEGKVYSVTPLNGFTANGISYFMNSDPQMKIDIPYPIEGKLTVNAEIAPLCDDIFYTLFENYKRDRARLERLEKKLVGSGLPDIKQKKYCPDEYDTGKMSADTGRQILYLDNGSGFRGMSPRVTPENKVGRDRLFIHEYSFNKEKLVRLRFDPAEKCGCIVYGMDIISNEGRLEIKRTNGFKLYDTFVFLTDDPQIEIAVPKGIRLTRVKIKAFIVPISDSLVFRALSDCKADLERYERLRKLLKAEN